MMRLTSVSREHCQFLFQIEICGEKQEWVEIILNNLGRLLFKGFEKSQAVRGRGI